SFSLTPRMRNRGFLPESSSSIRHSPFFLESARAASDGDAGWFGAPSTGKSTAALSSGRGHHRILLCLEFGDRNGADGNDDVGRNVQAAGRDPDRFLVRCFVEAIGLALVRAEEGKQPLDTDVIIDLLDLQEARVVELHLFRKISLDQEQRHDRSSPMKMTGPTGGHRPG